jgi:hypothetical protein
MKKQDITKEQAAQLSKQMFGPMNFLWRLRERMEKRGFPHNDPLYVLVCEAYTAMHKLSVSVHYLSCDGAGEPTKATEPEKLP